MYNKMFRNIRTMTVVSRRTYKNFGHKRQRVPFVTTLWHGFLTFTFIGLGIEWKRIKQFIFGDTNEEEVWSKLMDQPESLEASNKN